MPTYPNINILPFRPAGTDAGMALGTPGGADPDNKLWLPQWEGDFITAYDEYNVFETLVMHQDLGPGEVEKQYPVTGTMGIVPAWRAGQELSGGSFASTTISIFLDKRPSACHFDIDSIDVLNSQWQFRQEMARQSALALASLRDKQVAVTIAIAALSLKAPGDPRTALAEGPVFADVAFNALGARLGSTQLGFGAAITQVNKTEAALKLLSALEDFGVYKQENNITSSRTMCVVTPRAFQDLRSTGIPRSATEFTQRPMFGGVPEAGGLGTPLTRGLFELWDTLEYQGILIMKSNHLPTVSYADDTTTPIGEARYQAAWANVNIKALIFCSECVGSLNKIGLQTETMRDTRRGSNFFVSSVYKGTGVLRPELAAVVVGPHANNSAAGDTKVFNSILSYALAASCVDCNGGGTPGKVARQRLAAAAGLTAQATTDQSTTTALGPGIVTFNG